MLWAGLINALFRFAWLGTPRGVDGSNPSQINIVVVSYIIFAHVSGVLGFWGAAGDDLHNDRVGHLVIS